MRIRIDGDTITTLVEQTVRTMDSRHVNVPKPSDPINRALRDYFRLTHYSSRCIVVVVRLADVVVVRAGECPSRTSVAEQSEGSLQMLAQAL